MLTWFPRLAASRHRSPGLAQALAEFGGVLGVRLQPAARQAVRENLAHVFRRSPAAWEVEEVFREAGRGYLDLALLGLLPPQRLLARTRVSGWEHLDAALAQGRGAILVGTHTGAVSSVGQLLALRGYRAVAPVERLGSAALHWLHHAPRRRAGVRLVEATPAAWWALLAALRRNEVVALLGDRPVAGASVELNLFGCPARLPLGPALLASHSRAPLLPVRAFRDPGGRLSGEIDPPLAAAGLPTRELARRVAESLEYTIRRRPLQWLVFERVWSASRCPAAWLTGRMDR